MLTPISVARCWAVTTMPFSAATGRMEAASAAGTAASGPRQATSMTTRKSVATREIGLNSTDLSLLIQYFDAPAHRGVEGSRLLWVGLYPNVPRASLCHRCHGHCAGGGWIFAHIIGRGGGELCKCIRNHRPAGAGRAL